MMVTAVGWGMTRVGESIPTWPKTLFPQHRTVLSVSSAQVWLVPAAIARTPPVSIMAMNGLMTNARPFEVMGDQSASDAAAAVIKALVSGEIDAGILWGPLGGYYAQRAKVPLSLVPLVKEKAGPVTIYGITMGVRPNTPEWKHKLNKLIAENQADINAMLSEYNVPLLDANGNLIKTSTAER